MTTVTNIDRRSLAAKGANYILEGQIVAEQPLATCSKDLRDRAEARAKARGEACPLPVPVIKTPKGDRLMFPGTGIRGKLRRALRDVLRNDLIAKTGDQTPLSLDEHYFLTLGGIKGGAPDDKRTVAMEATWRQKNPLLSLFGAGDAGVLGFVQGRLSVGNGICTSADRPVVFSGARTDDLKRDKGQLQFLTESDIDSLISRSEGNRSASGIKIRIKAAKAELKAAQKRTDQVEVERIQNLLEQLEHDLKATKEETGTGDVSVGMPLAGWEAIPVGEAMDHRMIIAQASLVELGALLAALQEFSSFPVIGAHYANGCGLVSGSWEVFKTGAGKKESLGCISFAPFDCMLTVTPTTEGNDLDSALVAFESYLAGQQYDLSIPGA